MDADFIGEDDLREPYWATIDSTVASAPISHVAAALPRVAGSVVRDTWRQSRPLASAMVILHVASGLLVAFGLLATADAMAELIAAGPSTERVVAALPFLLLIVGSFSLIAVLDATIRAIRGVLLPRLEMAARDRLHSTVSAADLSAFDDADFVELVRRATAHGPSQLRYAASATGELVGSIVAMSAAVVTAGVMHPMLTPLVLLSAVPQGWASMRAASLAYRSFLHTTSLERRLGVTGDLLTNRRDAAELRAYNARPLILAQYRKFGAALAQEAAALEVRKTAIQLVGRSVRGVGIGVGYLVLGLLVYFGEIPIALAGAALIAIRTAATATQEAVEGANVLYEASFYLTLYDECVADAARRIRSDTGKSVTATPSVIDLDDVTYLYPGAREPAVSNVTLTLRCGEVVAIVGENGSGKTTLAKLIAGLYLPTHGDVAWDDMRTADIDTTSLYDHVALVMQTPVQWPTSAEKNIRVGRIQAEDPYGERLAAAAERSGADAVVRGLPRGYESLLSRQFQSGLDLSGGQWQRLSVARGLYRDAFLTIADEPTAALDAHAEHRVFTSLRELTRSRAEQQKITVLITHRLSNVQSVDRIIVLHRGRLVEVGTHDELLANQGVYATLYTMQAAAYARNGVGSR